MQVKTVSPLKEWEHLKFWSYYFSSELYNLEGLPDKENRFKALELTAPKDVRIVILGQDPYPTKGHAHGLAFSVQPHITSLPRSLSNIFQEYQDDLGYPKPTHGSLDSWAHNGVLLLNTILTVEEGKPNSHKGLGWEKLAFEVLGLLSEDKKPKVFILWGNSAKEYRARVDTQVHCIIESAHPSPLSVKSGFFGSKPFSKACNFLGIGKEIWKLP